MYKVLNVSILLFLIMIFSCKSEVPQPSDWAGDYEVSFQIAEVNQSISDMKDSMTTAMTTASSELQKAKEEMKVNFNNNFVDTTTSEGKIEYAAQQFGKKIAEASLELGGLSTQLGGIVSGMVGDNMGWAMSLLDNVKVPVTLQADGDIKVKSDMIFSLMTSKMRWEKIGDQIKITDENNEVKLLDIIADHGDSKLLTFENLKIKLNRVKVDVK